MIKGLENISVIAFDQDGTLYPYSPTYKRDLRTAQAEVIYELSDGRILHDEAYALCEASYDTLRSGWILPSQRLNVPIPRLHELFHARATMDSIIPLQDLREALVDISRAGITLAVITHSHMNYASRVLPHINLHDLIDPRYLVTLEQVGYREKQNDPEMFHEIQRRTGKPFEEHLVVEDSDANLIHAHRLGMRTNFIHWTDPRKDLPHIEFQHENTVLATRDVLKAVRPALVA